MDKNSLIHLDWKGRETVTAINCILHKAKQIEIVLPINYNHALFRVLHSSAPSATTETIDISAGPELLNDVSSVKGLEEFAALYKTLRKVQSRVKIVSPPTVIITFPSVSDKE